MDVIAHRGNSSQAPENTLAAFHSAIALRVDGIECDLRLSSDGVPIIIHDEDLERVTQGANCQAVHTLSLDELKRVDVGSHFHPKFSKETPPSLKDLLAMAPDGMPLFLELKKGSYPIEDLVYKVVKLVKNNPYALVGSFSYRAVSLLKEMGGDFKVMSIISCQEDLDLHLKIEGVDYLAIDKLFFMKVIDKYPELRRKKVWVWTLDDLSLIPDLIEHQVQGVITNTPEAVINYLSRR